MEVQNVKWLSAWQPFFYPLDLYWTAELNQHLLDNNTQRKCINLHFSLLSYGQKGRPDIVFQSWRETFQGDKQFNSKLRVSKTEVTEKRRWGKKNWLVICFNFVDCCYWWMSVVGCCSIWLLCSLLLIHLSQLMEGRKETKIPFHLNLYFWV